MRDMPRYDAERVRPTCNAPRVNQREPTREAKIHQRPGNYTEVAAQATTATDGSHVWEPTCDPQFPGGGADADELGLLGER